MNAYASNLPIFTLDKLETPDRNNNEGSPVCTPTYRSAKREEEEKEDILTNAKGNIGAAKRRPFYAALC